MRKIVTAVALAASLSAFSFSTARAEDRRERREERREERKEESGWVKLGERKVDFKAEKDVIEVGRGEKYTKLRIRVLDGDLELYKMKVIFEHGDPYTPDTRQSFKEGERSHDIDLPGDARTIKRVEFYYKSEHRRDPAVVELIGKEK